MTIRFVRLLVALFLATSYLAHASEPQWVEVRSPNFSVITDAGDRRGRDAALRFEQMRGAFGALLTKAQVNLSVPMQIVAFRNSKEMRQFAPLFNGKPTEVAGLFIGGQDRTFILLDMSVENPWTVVFHEYAHRLMDGNLTVHTDPWFEEGFAEYFASIEVDGKQARIGKIPTETYQILQQYSMMKVADLFRVQQNTKTYNESGDHRTVFYVQSGLVMHYIFDNQWMPKAGQYFDLSHNQNVPVDDAIQRAFGMTSLQFDKELRNYLSAGRYKYYALPAPKGLDAATFKVTAVTPLDAQVLLADLHLHSQDYQEKALAEYDAILKTDPNHAGALPGRAMPVCRGEIWNAPVPIFNAPPDKTARTHSSTITRPCSWTEPMGAGRPPNRVPRWRGNSKQQSRLIQTLPTRTRCWRSRKCRVAI